MDILSAIVAGLIGTLVMTILMYLAPMMGMPKMDIIGMLGTMFTPNTGTAMITMPVMLKMHPRPPQMDSGPMMMIGLIIGHLVFGLVVALTYNALSV